MALAGCADAFCASRLALARCATPDTARLGDTGHGPALAGRLVLSRLGDTRHGLALARCGGPLPLRTSRTISAALSDTASSPPAHGANQRRAKAGMRGVKPAPRQGSAPQSPKTGGGKRGGEFGARPRLRSWAVLPCPCVPSARARAPPVQHRRSFTAVGPTCAHEPALEAPPRGTARDRRGLGLSQHWPGQRRGHKHKAALAA